ncbi:hypothetical protein [Polaribacter sp. IC063]|uniref:hypothetical protein n=1 Tax=Polaribacter sp. IC063 TaxID=57031 RepID=UPI0011BDC8EA|nr:hypothetical protein [Polaribacter sp. IC063]TXD47818.1 hypothetical protein ES043_18115 [Polaribacter sp. IC063]
MQITELLKLTEWFDENIVEKGVPKKFTAFYNKMNQNIRRNGNQPLVPFEQEKENIINAIEDINFQSLSLEQINFLNQLEIVELIGKIGVQKIEEILIKNNLDIATATIKIKESSDTITKAQATIKELQTTLYKSFDIEENEEIEDNKVLMRVYFQNDVSIENLTDFKKLSATWYDIGRGIAMAQDKSPEDFNIIGAKKGSIIIEMAVIVGLATSVSKILLESLKVADRFVNVLKQVEELKSLKLGNKKIGLELKKEAEKERDAGTATILENAIIDLKLDAKQNGDKVTALQKSITKLIGFTQNGGIVDFVQPNEPDDEPENAEIREEIQRLKTNIGEIRLLENQIKLLENKVSV